MSNVCQIYVNRCHINGLNNINYLTSHSIWNLNKLPLNLGIIGCRPIECEIAQSFSLFGSNVLMIDMLDHILAKEIQMVAILFINH